MRLRALVRREAVLASFLAAAAALVVLASPLHADWLYIAGLIIAALGAVASFVIRLQRARVEDEIDQRKRDGLTRVPVGAVTQIAPTLIGVDAAAQTILAGEEVPDYVERDIDGSLRAAVSAALNGGPRWIVVVAGSSKVGKSRALFEALRHCAREGEIDLVAPVSGDALQALVASGEMPRGTHERHVLWLDDIEPFLDEGVTLQTLRDWRAGNHGGIIAATYGGKGSDQVEGSGSSKLVTLAGEVLQQARQVSLQETTPRELDPLRSELPAGVLESIERHGLAAYLVAAPALEGKLSTGRHALGEPECREGVALVYAAIDWSRCGRSDPIDGRALRELWPNYLAAGTPATDAGFDIGLAWALRPVRGTIALLEDTGSYSAYDYMVRFAGDRPPPHDAAWLSAIDDAVDAQALSVGTNAYLYGRHQYALKALQVASRSSASEAAAGAALNLGVTLGKLERPLEELDVYRDLVARFGNDQEPALRKRVATALVYLGVTLGELERPLEELDAYRDLVARFGDDPEPAVRVQVATALVNTGSPLGELDRPLEALDAYGEVVARYGDDPEPALRERVATARFNIGVKLAELNRPLEALDAYRDVVERYGDDAEPATRERVAKALLNMGDPLNKLNRPLEELDAYRDVVERCGEDPVPALREQAAKALLNMGVQLAGMDRPLEALDVYRDLVARFGDDSEPALRAQTAKALLNTGDPLGKLDRPQEELDAYGDVVDRYGDDPDPALREQAARALLNTGVKLGELDRPLEALDAYRHVVERYGDDPEPALRAHVALAFLYKGDPLGRLERPLEALEAYREVVERYGDDAEPALREYVARALLCVGVTLGALDRPLEELDAYRDLVARFGDDPEPAVREHVARARSAQARSG